MKDSSLRRTLSTGDLSAHSRFEKDKYVGYAREWVFRYMNLKPTKGLDGQVWFGLRMQY